MGDFSIPSAKSRDQLKQFEEKEDCFILEFDPDDELDLSKLSLSDSAQADVHIVAQKGKIACRDYPHPRHDCAKFPFGKTPYESHCELCYCYVCDFAAPCKKWGGKSKHCTAFDDDWWNMKRKLRREAVERKKEALKDFDHPRHMCMSYPFEQTSHSSHCEQCYCYVCELIAPCKEWVGTSGHCHAFNNQPWRSKRKLDKHAQLDKQQSKSIFGASTTASQHVQSNTVLSEDHQQEEQSSRTDFGGSVEGGESTDESSEEAKIYVENLPPNLTKHDLASLFKEVGVVKSADVIYVIGTGRGFGFVTMSSVLEAEKAVAVFNGNSLKGNVLTVKEVNPKRVFPVDEQPYSIYVGNLSRKVDNQRLEALFSDRGYKVVSARIILDRQTKVSRGFGFVAVSSEPEGEDAIRTLNGHVLDGRKITLNQAHY